MHGIIAHSITYWLVQDWERSTTGLSAVTLFVSSTEHVMRNTGLDELQARIKIGRRKHQQPQICEWHHSNGRKWRGTKQPLVESERGEWKSWLKTQHSENLDHGIWSHHFMANRREKTGNTNRFFSSWAPKSLWTVTAAMKLKDACSLEEKLLQS